MFDFIWREKKKGETEEEGKSGEKDKIIGKREQKEERKGEKEEKRKNRKKKGGEIKELGKI